MQCNATMPGLPSSSASPSFDNFSCRRINRPDHSFSLSIYIYIYRYSPLPLNRPLFPVEREKPNNKTPTFDFFSRVGSLESSLLIRRGGNENRKQNKSIKLDAVLLGFDPYRILPYLLLCFIYFEKFFANRRIPYVMATM